MSAGIDSAGPALAEALAHVERGWAPLPVSTDKTPAHRLIRATRGRAGWKQLERRPAGTDEVRAWFELDPGTGIGVITGEVSGLVVVDVDDPATAPELPFSATSLTPRGRHVWGRCDQPVRTRVFEWGELRAEGSYNLAPLSRGYRWETTPEEAGELAELAHARVFETFADPPPYIRTTCFIDTDPRAREGAAWLADLERSEPAAIRLAEALGAPESLQLGETFLCPIHADRRPSASLWRREPDAHVLFRDWHARDEQERWLTLALARARLAGRDGKIAAPEAVVWKARLAYEAGLLEPFDVAVDCRPPAPLERAWDGFLFLLALRWTIEPGIAAPFSARFAASWLGVSTREAHEAVSELARRGFLRLQGRDPRGCRLWLPNGIHQRKEK